MLQHGPKVVRIHAHKQLLAASMHPRSEPEYINIEFRFGAHHTQQLCFKDPVRFKKGQARRFVHLARNPSPLNKIGRTCSVLSVAPARSLSLFARANFHLLMLHTQFVP